MFKCFALAMLCGLIVSLGGGCASLPAQDKHTETLEPSGVREDCMQLFPGDTLNYYFEASGPLNFNIHYHEAGNVSYAVSKNAVSTGKESFLCDKEQYYCLMWTNTEARPATLVYEWSVIKKQK